MANDYKRAAYRPKTKLPGWLGFLLGLGIGLFVAFLVYIEQRDAPEKLAQQMPLGPPLPSAVPGQGKDNDVIAPRFDFYTILPGQEVVIPDQEIQTDKDKAEKPEKPKPKTEKDKATPAPLANTSPAKKKGSYVIQVGSYRRYEDADRLKAQLALLGIESSVQTVNDSLYRVRVGPFDDMERANQMRNRLKSAKYDTLLLQLKT